MSMGFTLREDEHQAMLPKLPRRSQRLLTRSIDYAPARFCTRIAASFKTTRWHNAPTLAFRSSQKLRSSTNPETTEALFLLISLPILKAVQAAMDDGPQKSNLLTKVLRDTNQTEIPPHPYPNGASMCPVYCFNQEKMVQHFAFYSLLLSTSHLFLLLKTMANNFNL